MPVAHDHNLVEFLTLRVRESPAPQPVVVGRQVLGGDGETLPGHDEHQQPAVVQVAGAMAQERVLRPLTFRIVVVRRIEKEQPERLVRNGGLEQVRRQGAAQTARRLFRSLLVQLHPVGLDGDRVDAGQPLGQLRQGFPRSAAGVEDAERLPVPVVGARRHPYQRGDAVNHPFRRGVTPPFRPVQPVS